MQAACSHGAYTSYKQPTVHRLVGQRYLLCVHQKTRSRQGQHGVLCRVVAGTTALLLLLLLSECLRSGVATNQARAGCRLYIHMCVVCERYLWVK